MGQKKHNIIYVLVKKVSCAIVLDQDRYIYWIIMCFVLHVVNTFFSSGRYLYNTKSNI